MCAKVIFACITNDVWGRASYSNFSWRRASNAVFFGVMRREPVICGVVASWADPIPNPPFIISRAEILNLEVSPKSIDSQQAQNKVRCN